MFKVGDYAVDKFGIVFHIRSGGEKAIINCASIKFRHATEEEIVDYHKIIGE